MIPGKKYKPEDFLEMAWRRKWIIAVPLVVFAIGAFIWARTLPNRYRSEATVLVVPPQVPDKYVKETITEPLKERLELIRQQILSRTRLEQIIEEFNLYPKQRKELLMEQVVEQMRKDIAVVPAKSGRRQDPGHFTVSYDSENPETAMLVTQRLASVFVKENTEGRNLQTDVTIQFFQSQLDEAHRKLRDHEAKLEAFRKANAGRLPNEVDNNNQLMQNARHEIDSLTDSMSRDRDRQITIERAIVDETAIGTTARGRGTANGKASEQSATQELMEARAALAALQLKLKEDHPDVRAAKRHVSELEQKVTAEALQQPVSEGASSAAVAGGDAERQRRIAQLRRQADEIDREINDKKARVQRAQASIAGYEARIQGAPVLESQLSELNRDYATYKTTYENLLRKLEDAKIAASLEQRQVGEQFKIIDPARRPEQPRSPDRVRINMTGALIGLCLGLALAGLLEYRDTSLRTEDDVIAALSLPVVSLVPRLWTDWEIKKLRQRRLLVASCVALTLVFSAAAIVWKLRLLSSWGL